MRSDFLKDAGRRSSKASREARGLICNSVASRRTKTGGGGAPGFANGKIGVELVIASGERASGGSDAVVYIGFSEFPYMVVHKKTCQMPNDLAHNRIAD